MDVQVLDRLQGPQIALQQPERRLRWGRLGAWSLAHAFDCLQARTNSPGATEPRSEADGVPAPGGDLLGGGCGQRAGAVACGLLSLFPPFAVLAAIHHVTVTARSGHVSLIGRATSLRMRIEGTEKGQGPAARPPQQRQEERDRRAEQCQMEQGD